MLKSKFCTIFGRGRGAALAAILVVFAFTACVDPTSSGSSGGPRTGNAARTTIDDFTLTGFYNRVEYAGATSITCTPSGTDLSITFTGDSGGVVEEAVKDYFTVWTPEVIDNTNRVYEYNRDNIYVIFRAGKSPSFEMEVYKNPPESGDKFEWPSRELLEAYGLHGFHEINIGATENLRHNTLGNTLTITFVDSDGSNGPLLEEYFANENWVLEGSTTESGIVTYSYYRGIASVSFTPSPGMNGVCIVDVSREINVNDDTGGWPLKDTTDSYGLLGLTPPAAEDRSLTVHSTTTETDPVTGVSRSVLSIGFYEVGEDGAAVSHIRNYFEDKEANNWSLAGGGGTSSYSRGITTVILDSSQSPYYTLEVDVERIKGTVGWPDAGLLQTYSLPGFTMPAGVVPVPDDYPDKLPSPLIYVTGTKETGEGTTEDPKRKLTVITLHFYGTADTETAVRNYFSTNNKWTGGVNNSVSNTLEYSRGLGYAVFETSGRPYYTLEVDVEPVTGTAGWPPSTLLKKYGLFGMTERPGGVSDVALSYTEGDPGDLARNLLRIDFYGKDTTGAYINDYFTKPLNNWVYDSKYATYSRGLSTVSFDSSQAPRYALEIDLEPGGDAGWPSETLLREYGLVDMIPAAENTDLWPDTELPSHRKGYADNTASTDLVMRFYGTAATEIAVTEYFSGGGWTGTQSDGYSRGNTFVNFNPQSPYFELIVSVDRPEGGIPGWPGEELIKDYGLHGITQPTGPEVITYGQSADGINKSLTVTIMDGSDAVEEHFTKYFTAANHWSVPEPEDPPKPVEPGVSSWYRGLSYVNLDVSGKPTIVLDISVEDPGTSENLPTEAQLSRYQLGGFGLASLSPPDFDFISYSENEVESARTPGTKINQLTIRFYGTTAAETVIRNYFNTAAVWNYSELNTYTRSAGGTVLFAVLETGGSPYYELVVDRELGQGGTPGWPGTALLKAYGLMDMNAALWKSWGVTGENAYYTNAVPAGGTAEVLTLKLYGTAATEGAINSYFDPEITPANKWEYVDLGGTTDLISYVRGLTTVSINYESSDVNYFELTVSVKPSDGATPDWPTPAILREYGLLGFSGNIVSYGGIPVNYSTGVTPADGENPADRQNLTIRFNGTASTQAYIEDYFSAENKWTEVAGSEPITYTRGLAEVTLETAAWPHYYEISSNMEDINSMAGWLTLAERQAVGLYGGELETAPTGTGVSHLGYSASETALSIRFYETSDTAVVNYFTDSAGTGWTLDFAVNDTWSYSKGISNVFISAEERPFYEITVSRVATGTTGLPDDTVLSEYSIPGIGTVLTAPAANELSWEYLTDTDGKVALVLKFYGTAALETALDTWIVGAGWTKSTSSEYIRSNEGYMILDTAAKPYYELHIYKGLVLAQGWPAELMAGFGLTGSPSLNDESLGVIVSGYNHLVDENRLILDFPLASSADVNAWFTGSGNRWAAGTNDTPGVTAYWNETATHALFATLTDYQNEDRCELVIERVAFAGTHSGWPTSSSLSMDEGALLLGTYKFKNLGSETLLAQPTDAQDVSWVEEESPDSGTKSLVIRFNGSTTEPLAGNQTFTSMDTAIKAAGNGETPDADYEEGWIADTGSAASGVYAYSYYPGGGAASTLYMEFEPYSAVKPYFKITISQVTGGN